MTISLSVFLIEMKNAINSALKNAAMKKLVGGNWKMNCTMKTFQFFENTPLQAPSDVDVFIAVPYVYTGKFAEYFGSNVKMAAQDVSMFAAGAYTGEVSAKMLSELGFEYVLVGHSERRTVFSESDESINKKLKMILETNMRPVLCIGEPASERSSKRHIDFLSVQFAASTREITNASFDVAYEPIWAIGTGRSASTAEIEEVLNTLKSLMSKQELSGRVIYGGSVSKSNAGELSKIECCDGFLVGNGSLGEDFQGIIDAGSEAKPK